MHSAALRRNGILDGTQQASHGCGNLRSRESLGSALFKGHDLSTTYNNLRDLVQAGLVREVAVEGRAARFDAKGMRHHHFICDRCGNVEDIEWYGVPRPASGSLGKRILRECELIFRGLCTKCAPRRTSR